MPNIRKWIPTMALLACFSFFIVWMILSFPSDTPDLTWRSTSDLIQHSTHVMAMPPHVRYQWRSNQEFIVFTRDPPQSLTLMNVRTGSRTSLDELQQHISKYVRYTPLISPDGERTLWGGDQESSAGVTSAKLDGSSLVKRKTKPGEFWTTGSNPIWSDPNLAFFQRPSFQLQWLPDGQRLSYIYKGELWVVSTP